MFVVRCLCMYFCSCISLKRRTDFAVAFSLCGLKTMSSRTVRSRLMKSKTDPIPRTAATTSLAASKTTTPSTTDDSDECKTSGLYLLKSEPHEFSIEDLKRKGREEWDGVRNYTARNYLRQMKVGDRCWFYHSSCKTPAIVGTCRIVRQAKPDQTALDPNHEYYDPKSTKEKCRWDSCLVEFESIYETPITLKELRTQAKTSSVIDGMLLFHRSRLSVMPVTHEEWQIVEDLMKRKERNEDLLSSPRSV